LYSKFLYLIDESHRYYGFCFGLTIPFSFRASKILLVMFVVIKAQHCHLSISLSL